MLFYSVFDLTLAPVLSNSLTHRKPIPSVPPVTNAILSFIPSLVVLGRNTSFFNFVECLDWTGLLLENDDMYKILLKFLKFYLL